VSSSQLIQYIFSGASQEGDDFDKPFFLTYFNTSLFSLYLFGFFSSRWRLLDERDTRSHSQAIVDCMCCRYTTPTTSEETRRHIIDDRIQDQDQDGESEQNDNETDQSALIDDDVDDDTSLLWPAIRVAQISVLICPIWFVANYTFNASLAMTSVSSNTILSSSSGIWTLIIGSAMRVDRFSVVKVAAVACSFGGVIMVSLVDSSSPPDQLEANTEIVGDVLALLSAIAYGLYSVLLKKLIPDERQVSTPMFFSLLGLFNLLLLWPLFVVLDASGVEPFELPDATLFGFLLLNGIVGTVFSDYLWLIGVILTSPLVTTIGMSLTVPLAMISDALFNGSRFSPVYIGGSLLVVVAFLIVNLDDRLLSPLLRRAARALHVPNVASEFLCPAVDVVDVVDEQPPGNIVVANEA
jgi:solute carrier family 35, member F5